MRKRFSAIDLYSGIGGWTIGLELAGVEVKRCYEWWERAVETYNQNLDKVAKVQDIRKLSRSGIDLDTVDIVVGSPPCTQFSFSNRGGKGDIADGLKDIAKFLELVKALKPTFWAMENVPRVSKILARELEPGGQLTQYADLVKVNLVVDASEFGLPQRRKRMVAGDFPVELFLSYRTDTPELTLGDVVKALHVEKRDPIYSNAPGPYTEMETEEPLSRQETRLNRDAKRFHPVYNRMPFPDPLDKPARTVTALCTRVSRESIVVADSKNHGNFRRPSIRERASLQGFPATYQIFGSSYTEKLKMVGNAIPPVLTYFIANAMLRRKRNEVRPLSTLSPPNRTPTEQPPKTSPATQGRSFPESRRFRSAIPSLRFGSGMRFELVNDVSDAALGWKVDFYFGPSRAFERIRADQSTLTALRHMDAWTAISTEFAHGVDDVSGVLRNCDAASLQRAWNGRGQGLGPFDVCDALGEWAARMTPPLAMLDETQLSEMLFRIVADPGNGSRRKLIKNAASIISGFAVASWFNTNPVVTLSNTRDGMLAIF